MRRHAFRLHASRLIAPLAIALSGLSIHAAHAADAGVYRGTLGNDAIAVCINPAVGGSQTGSYYLARLPEPVGLEKTGASWRTEEGGEFRLEASGSGLSGQGHLEAKTANAPLKLNRVPSGDERPCASDAYNLAIERASRIVPGVEPENFAGQSYRTLTVNGNQSRELSVQSIELLGQGTGVGRINSQLRELLPQTPLEMSNTFYDCRRDNLGERGQDGQFQLRVQPELWTSRWFGVSTTVDSYCGGANPDYRISHRTWDLKTGEELDLWRWIAGGRVVTDELGSATYSEAPAALNTLLLAKATGSRAPATCAAALRGNRNYLLRLSDRGLVFSTRFAAAQRDCNTDIEVPFDTLKPFLSPEGKQALGA